MRACWRRSPLVGVALALWAACSYQAARLAMVPEGRDVEPVSSQVLTHGALQSVPWHLSMEARERVPRYLIQQEVEYNLGRALCHVRTRASPPTGRC